MIICRTSQPEKLRKNFIKSKPLAVIKWVISALVLTAVMVIVIITEVISRELAGWMFLLLFAGFLTVMSTSVSRTENKFNAFVTDDNGNIIFINIGNIFMNSRLFGEQLHFSHSIIRVFIEWSKASNRMSEYSDGTSLDKLISNEAVLGNGYYVEKVFSIKSNNKYMTAKLRLKKCKTIEGELFTEFTKTIRIPKNFENAEFLENQLITASEK